MHRNKIASGGTKFPKAARMASVVSARMKGAEDKAIKLTNCPFYLATLDLELRISQCRQV